MSQSSLASSSDSQPLAVELDGVTKRYGSVVAVSGVSFVVRQGEAVALVGPSGAGKTTLLRLIAGSVAANAGNLLLHGRDVSGLSPGRELSGLVGVVAQQYDLVPTLSVLQNVLAGRLGAWGAWRSLLSLVVAREKPDAMRALERVGMSGRADERAGRLSGGEQQRVAIARVLLQSPAIVLADEPVASLDPARADAVLSLLLDIVREQGRTLVASMHAVEQAKAHFDRLVGVRNGSIQFDATPAEVTDQALTDLYRLEGMRAEPA